ncbi:hypothetical protein B0H10DRAFT_2005487 [Mycena sp. CBHHK59/15]|nr:hypothetical protein B0H10DRAFT_2005487 [Mycena sp. CBHHK59/15]
MVSSQVPYACWSWVLVGGATLACTININVSPFGYGASMRSFGEQRWLRGRLGCSQCGICACGGRLGWVVGSHVPYNATAFSES